ncbi:NHL repeat-containing protein [Couchioplanes caeruleus]|uniref:Uncharacterized protein n=2 Tax=Couchioplanes caeruleus TaxID=56438 RepID=A0A1K0F9Y4_9ACTN|nr:PQQ-binding-like beta-propeller repeat protein [Couchioplanes caeruleus]OJF09544.1 hypothetical protein BG844_37015 [Couchioplanes caeruleus subsp. caeruleus]
MRRTPWQRRGGLLAVLVLALSALLPVGRAEAAGPAAGFVHPAGPVHPAECAREGAFNDLGPVLSTLTLMRGVLGTRAGRPVWYSVVAGDDARINVVDALTRELVTTTPMRGAAGAWALTVASDGRLYVGTYNSGRFYRFDPANDQLTDLGQPVPEESFVYGLSIGPDGTVYGGTYPHGHAFAYHPTSGVTDIGEVSPGHRYARATAYNPDHHQLFVGLPGPATLVRIDLATGTRTTVDAGLASLGTLDDLGLDYAGGRVFVYGGGALAVVDAVTSARRTLVDGSTGAGVATYPMDSRGVSPVSPDGAAVYLTSGSALRRYDLAADRIDPVVPAAGTPAVDGPAIGYGWIDGALYGLAGNYRGRGFTYDPGTRRLDRYTLAFAPAPVQLAQLTTGPDGAVYVSAYINGQLARYDPATGRITAQPRLGQVEGWHWRDAAMYAGIYPYGAVLARHTLFTGPTTANDGELLLGRDERIHVQAGGRLFEVDLWCRRVTQIGTGLLFRLTAGHAGDFYSLLRTADSTVPNRLARYVPPPRGPVGLTADRDALAVALRDLPVQTRPPHAAVHADEVG